MMDLIIKHSIQQAEKPTKLTQASQTDKVVFTELLGDRPEFSLNSLHEIDSGKHLSTFQPQLSMVRSESPISGKDLVKRTKFIANRPSRSKAQSKPRSRLVSPPAEQSLSATSNATYNTLS